MSELLDSSSAGIFHSSFLSFFIPPDLSAPISALLCQARPLTLPEPCSSPRGSCKHPVTSLPPLTVSLFPSFPRRVFKVSPKCEQMTYMLTALNSSFRDPLFISSLFPSRVISSCLFHLIPQSVPLSTLLGRSHTE